MATICAAHYLHTACWRHRQPLVSGSSSDTRPIFSSIVGITKAFEYSITNACIGWIGVHCDIYAMKRWVGRRSLIIFGAFTCGLCELACGIAASVSPNSISTENVLVAFTSLFMFIYDACVGVAAFSLANELVSSRLRAWTVGRANALGYFLAWLVGFCSPYFINSQDLNWVVYCER